MSRPERRFWFQLASLFGCTVAEAMQRCDVSEFREWMAFYSLDPWGGERGDMRAGIVAAAVVNMQRASSSPAVNASDFMPKFGPRDENEKPTQSLDNMKAAVHAFAG